MTVVITAVGAALGGGFGREGLIDLLDGTEEPTLLVGRPKGKRYTRRYDRFGSMDTFSRLGFVAAEHAMDEGRMFEEGAMREHMGVLLGTRFGCHEENQRFDRFAVDPEEGVRNASPLSFKGTVDNAPAGWISVAFGMRGPNLTYVSGLGAAAEALATARVLIEQGVTQAALAGGVERRTVMMSELQPESGLGHAEGAAVCLLESLDHAKLRKQAVLAELVDVSPAGTDSLSTMLDAHGLEPSDIALCLTDPRARRPSSELTDGIAVRNLGSRTGDLHGAWGGVATALLAATTDRRRGLPPYTLAQIRTEDRGRDHWVLLREPR